MPRAPKTNDLRQVHAGQRHDDISGTTRRDATLDGSSSIGILIIAVVLISAILLGGGGCSTKEPSWRPECPSLDAADYYFPKGALYPSRAKVDELLRGWYSKNLAAMLEPSLSCGTRPDGFAYRFLWLRNFHHPIAVRVEKNGSSVTLTAVELAGTGGQAPGEVIKRIDRALLPAEQDKLLARLNGVEFGEIGKDQNRFGMDGAQWILEGAEDGRYHVVDRWSPGPGPYRDICLVFLGLAGLAIPKAEMY